MHVSGVEPELCQSSFSLLCHGSELCLISDLTHYLSVKHKLEIRILCIYRLLFFFNKSQAIVFHHNLMFFCAVHEMHAYLLGAS